MGREGERVGFMEVRWRHDAVNIVEHVWTCVCAWWVVGGER
jgi:hypothetical protein